MECSRKEEEIVELDNIDKLLVKEYISSNEHFVPSNPR
jgi:hypothetical protein